MATQNLLPTDVTVSNYAHMTAFVDPVERVISDMVPSRYTVFSVGDYFVYGGLPVGDSSYAGVISVEAGVGEFNTVSSLAPNVVESSAASRWLPLAASFQDGVTWAPTSGFSRIPMITEGFPLLIADDHYISNNKAVQSSMMLFNAGEYMYTSGMRWSDDDVAFAMVCVPMIAPSDEYVLLETGLSPSDIASGQINATFGDYLSIRYDKNATVSCWVGDDLVLQVPTNAGGLQSGKPMVIGFKVSMTDKHVIMGVVDSMKKHTVAHALNHPYSGEIYAGRGASGGLATASMKVLDMALLRDSSVNFDELLDSYNAMYGVCL